METTKWKNPDLGMGIAIGMPAGLLLGLIFLNGNIALGISIVILFLFAYSSLPEKRTYAFIAIGAGAVAGALIGVVLGLIHGQYAAAMQLDYVKWLFGLPYKSGYVLVCTILMAAVGLPVGVAWGQRSQGQGR